MNPDLFKKVCTGVGVALASILGLFAGKKVSDREHAPTYKRQEEQAKDINELYRNKG
ncbi:hypothetical protein SDC9_61903 [bioreactor metagenome]|uniref:Uncharacterized protein n=1 Tax=bioreactor metagenome TaxID=1076179 RepID=A0A644XH42_9ZZZZ